MQNSQIAMVGQSRLPNLKSLAEVVLKIMFNRMPKIVGSHDPGHAHF